MADKNEKLDRRSFVGDGFRVAGAVVFAGSAGFLAGRKGRENELVWQIDPDKCICCGNCATYCVLDVSAVKAVQCYELCAMCDVCTGYFALVHLERSTAAENQLCPTGAIVRKFVAEQAGVPRFEYHIVEEKCIGCGKCVEGCALMNGSLYLQVRHDRCLNCNECSIAVACPTQAFRRVSADEAYLMKKKAREVTQRKAEDV
jgi:H+/Na+-translocating ferredoxin:NAD+ oxidoreductase subunit B